MERNPNQELADLVSATRLHAQRESRRGRRRIAGPNAIQPTAAASSAPVSRSSVPAPAASDTQTSERAAPKHVPREVAAVTTSERASVPAPAAPGQANPQPAAPSMAPGSALPADLAPQAQTLEALRASVADCRACGLCETRKQTVFADGSGAARVLFVGEAPGADEDASGVPFVGKAGQLLTDIITKGMKLQREDVYIANVLKCRPPGNRDPEPTEKALCTPWLDRQIELIRPQVIIPLGKHASQHMLGCQDSMGRMRGRVHQVRGQQIVPTYHPAFLLRSPNMKKECWADIKLALGVLGLL